MSTTVEAHLKTSRPGKSKALAFALTCVMVVFSLLATAAPASAQSTDQLAPTLTAAKSNGIEGLFGSDIATVTQARQLWGHGLTGAGVDIAVIDTGVAPVVGLDAPGKIINGPDFSFSSANKNLRHLDQHGHGTAMASLAAGAPTSRDGLLKKTDFAVGLAPEARIVNVKVGDPVGAVDVSQVIAAIDWVVQNRDQNGMNIRVMLLAYGTDSLQPYQVDPLSFAVENAWRHGIFVVVASGNDGRNAKTLANPATNPSVLAVGAVEQTEKGWGVPAWGSQGDGIRNPDVLVPGAPVLAPAVPGSFLATNYPNALFKTDDGLMIRGSGTSQAAAAAAGAAALLIQGRPNATPDELKLAITQNARRPGRQLSDRRFEGHGVLNVLAALKANTSGRSQAFAPATGTGSLDLSRGSDHVVAENDKLQGEYTVFGDEWLPEIWVKYTSNAMAFSDQVWHGDQWLAGNWLSPHYSGGNWSSGSWSGGSWSSGSWSAAEWSSGSWSGGSWSSGSWSSGSWSSGSWSSGSWSSGSWSSGSWG